MAAFAKNTLSVNVVSSSKVLRQIETPPSGSGISFIQNQLENERSYRGRIGKKEVKSKRNKKSKKKKSKTRAFLDECGIYL